jgi:hypothetical protein
MTNAPAQLPFDPQAIPLIKQQLAEARLDSFVKQAWHVVEPGKPLNWNWRI